MYTLLLLFYHVVLKSETVILIYMHRISIYMYIHYSKYSKEHLIYFPYTVKQCNAFPLWELFTFHQHKQGISSYIANFFWRRSRFFTLHFWIHCLYFWFLWKWNLVKKNAIFQKRGKHENFNQNQSNHFVCDTNRWLIWNDSFEHKFMKCIDF